MFWLPIICFDSTIIGDQNIRYLCHFKADLRAISVIEKFSNEPKSIEIKKYEYDANARSKKYRDTNEYDSRKYDPEKRRQKHLQDEEKYAEELAKYQKQSRQNFDYIC